MKQFGRYFLIIAALLLQAGIARGEWYLGGYGGINMPQSLSDVSMNNLGQTLAVNRVGYNSTNVLLGDQLIQNFRTSDLSLKNSSIFGGKVGYFFNDEGLPWLGVELESFTTTPTIKTQTVSTTQDITFIPTTFQPVCPLPTPNNVCPYSERLKSTLSVTESTLRLVAVTLNVIARYPGKTIQPYIGIGGGAFYFQGSGMFSGNQVVPGLNALAGAKVLVTPEWGFFLEGKYNLATISTLDHNNGLSGQYSAFSGLAGLAYHF